MTFDEPKTGRPLLMLEVDDAVVLPNATWTREESFTHAGRYDVTVETKADGLPSRRLTTKLLVRNPALDKARALCRDCNGDFAAHGMLGIVSCLCRMPDAGKPCDDGDACEGECVSTSEGYRCSEFRTVFGCHAYLPHGWSRQKPSAGRLRRVPSICVD